MADLAITTSTDVLSVAISIDDASACETMHLTRRHAEEITPIIRRLSEGCEIELDKIENIFVDAGPGRFTGLRVGISTAVGVALGSGATISTLNSLEVLRHSLAENMSQAASKPCLLYTSPSPRDQRGSRMPSSA